MTGSDQETPTWSRRRWFWVLFLAWGIQILLVYCLSDRSEPQPRQVVRELTTRHLDSRIPGVARLELQSVADPTLYALPSSRGFAGVGWREGEPYAPPPAEWTEGPRWLTNSPTALGQRLEARLASAPPANALLSKRPRPRLSEPAAPPLPLLTQSQVRVEGDLAARGLRMPLVVPSVAHSNVLANTVVQVWVRPDGEPFSAVLLRSCGLKSADAKALALAASAWFNPDPAATSGTPGLGARWGELSFQWHTVAEPSTAAPPPANP